MITLTLILTALVAVVSLDIFELPSNEVEARPTGKPSSHRHPRRKSITSISPAKMQGHGPAHEPAVRVAA